MDYFDLDLTEQRLPPEETRFLSLQVEPYPDGRRVHVNLQLTPFLQPPCIDLSLVDSLGNSICSVSIIEPPRWEQEITMHLRNLSLSSGEFTLSACLFYPEREDLDQRSIKFMIPGVS